MTKSNFLNSLQKKIDKFDIRTLKEFLNNIIEDFDSLKTVFNSMAEGVCVIDTERNIIFFNKAAAKFLDVSLNSTGIKLDKAIKKAKMFDIINNAIKNDEKLIDYEFNLDSPYAKYITISIQPLVREGKILGNIIILNDITIGKENEMRLRQAESISTLTNISAGIAHEIKNPLGAIGIHIQLIEQQINKCKCKWSDDFKYSTHIIKEEIDRLSDIVNNFLFTVKPLKSVLMPVNLKDYLDKFLDFILPELDTNHIKLKKNYNELPDVWLDENHMRQALLNLIQNSIHAIKNININHGFIEIESYQEKNYVYINIIDNGEGIGDNIQTKVFDPYFTTKNYGTGLGLTIVYKIIKEHNGDIYFSSNNDKTIFTIRLPSKHIEKGLIEYYGEQNGN